MAYSVWLMLLGSLSAVLSHVPNRRCGVNFTFANYYGDTMVLQRSPASAVVWGYAFEIGDAVTVTINVGGQDLVYETTAITGEGVRPVWRVTMDPVDAGGPYVISATSQDCTITLTDVLFGDVWLCSGQSNMYHRMDQLDNPEDDIADSVNYPNVRTLYTALVTADTPQEDAQLQRNWAIPTADNIAEYSAVCWLFGTRLYDKFNVPIGLIHSSWGGTRIEAWSSPAALDVCFPDGAPPDDGANAESVLYNSMIYPYQQFPIYGAIWYQGEANFGNYQDYACAQREMVEDWRASWLSKTGSTDPQFPFGVTQLAPNAPTEDFGQGFPAVRWEQSGQEGYLPSDYMQRFFMAVSIDLADFDSPHGSIHPRYKRQIADRLALAAFNVAYGVDLETRFQGPFPTDFQRIDSEVSIVFDGGDVVLETRDLTNTMAYQICCAVDASTVCAINSVDWLVAPIARVDSATVVVNVPCAEDQFVTGVRYAWKESPCPELEQCAIYSAGGDAIALPAPPFIWSGFLPLGN